MSRPLNRAEVSATAESLRLLRHRVDDAPDEAAARVLSFIPTLTPMTMLPGPCWATSPRGRCPSPWPWWRSSTHALVRLGGQIYSGATLRSGKVKLREAWRGAV